MNYTYQCDTVGILPAVYVFTGNDSYACVQSELDRAQSADSWYTVSGNATREVIGKMGFKSLNKGIRLTVDDTQVHVWMKVNIRYGYNVPDTCAAVQDRVVTAIETMTGLTVAEVNVRVNSVVMDGAGTGTAD